MLTQDTPTLDQMQALITRWQAAAVQDQILEPDAPASSGESNMRRCGSEI